MNCHYAMGQHQVDVEAKLTNDFQGLNAEIVPLNTLDEFPAVAIGRLFVSPRQGYPRCDSCTAFWVGENTIMTAAHCVMGLDGSWRRGLMFLSQFGTNNQKAVGVSCAAVHPRWSEAQRDEDLHYDYAILQVNKVSASAVLPLANTNEVTRTTILGYKNNCCGNRMIEVRHPAEAVMNNQKYWSVSKSPLGEGGSGAPWLNTQQQVVSLSSHYAGLSNKKLYGPKLNHEAVDMLGYVSAGCQ